MSRNIPKPIQLEIRAQVFKKADEVGYLAQDRPRNRAFIDQLVAEPAIGKRLSEFMPKEAVRTYIKDAILHRYTKERTAQTCDLAPIISAKFGAGALEIECRRCDGTSLYRLNDGVSLVVARGTWVKWETALRRGLDFIARSPGLTSTTSKGDGAVRVLLVVSSNGRKLTQPDRDHLAKALGLVGVVTHVVETSPRPVTRATGRKGGIGVREPDAVSMDG